MNPWLLAGDVFARIEAAILSGFQPSAEQQAEFMARASLNDGSRIMSVAGDRAAIQVKGVLTDTPDIMAMIFGGGNTTYGEIISAIAAAEADPSISEIVLYFNSPGGAASALWGAAMDSVFNTKKKSTAIVSQAASAAYGLAAQTDRIVAENNFAVVGSVGIVAQMRVPQDVITVTSSEAPAKAPDPRTPEGLAMMRAQLDAIHTEFAGAIARGRDTTVDNVNATYGRGAIVLAVDAKARGMLDEIAGPAPATVPKKSAVPGGKPKAVAEAEKMDLNKLKAEHPEVFAAVLAMGVQQERDRVNAHLKMAETVDGFDIAHKAIKEGTDFLSPTMQAEYQTAAVAKTMKAVRGAEEPQKVTPPNGGQPAPAAKPEEQAGAVVAGLVEAAFGIEPPAAK